MDAPDEPRPDQDRPQEARRNGRTGTSDGDEETTPAPTYTGPIYSTRFKLLVVAVAVLAVVAMTWIYLRTVDGDDPDPAVPDTSSGVVGFTPAEGSQVLQQQSIAVDLTPGWDGNLTIDGVAVPEDQLTRSGAGRDAEQQGREDRLEFVPGEGKVLESLAPGRTCVTAQVWPRATGPEGETRTATWCFTVV